MKLVEDWKQCLKWFSVQSMIAAMALQSAWIGMPPDLKANIPALLVNAVSIGILVLGFVGRLVDQPKPK